MTINFQTWMQAVWHSIVEPSDAANRALAMKVPREALWTGLLLAAVLNVILLVALLSLSPAANAMQGQLFTASPFGYLMIMAIPLIMFVFGIHYSGQMFGGQGSFEGALTVIVWFQAINLTLEAIQLVIFVISPAIAALFGMLAFGAMLWCFINFINVLHSFGSLLKAVFSILVALIITAFSAGILLTLFGVAVPGATP